MLKITKTEIRNRRIASGTWREYTAKPRVYIFPKGEKIIENLFVGRHNRPTDVYKREVVPAIKQAIVDREMATKAEDDTKVLTVDMVEMRWSQKAGCSCGCSPGYIVTLRGAFIDVRFDVFVAVEAEDDAAAVTPGAKPLLDELRQAQKKSGRSESGRLRNFKSMTPEKRMLVAAEVAAEDNDPEALVALGLRVSS